MPQPFLALNRDVTEKSLRQNGERLRDGKLTLARFEKRASKDIRDGAIAAFRFANGGPLSGRQLTLLNNLLSEQRTYFDKFIAGIRSGDVALTAVPNRATLYMSAVVQGETLGTLTREGQADKELTWTAFDDGGTCDTCHEMDGKTMTAAEWAQSPILPTMGTDCMANCRCSVE